MLPRFSVTNQRQTATWRSVFCFGCIGLSFLAIVGFGLLPRTKAAGNILPNHQVSAAPVNIQPKFVASYGKLPLRFEANRGQTDGRVRFLARGEGYTIFLTSDEAVLELEESGVKSQKSVGMRLKPGVRSQEPEVAPSIRSVGANVAPSFRAAHAGLKPGATTALRMRLVGANASAPVTGVDELPGKSNYFIGNDRKKWRTDVSNYSKVKYQNVYPGVDLVYYGNQRQLEYDFVVAPGADPSAIVLGRGAVSDRRSAVGTPPLQKRAHGHAPLQIAPDGDLVVRTDGGEILFHKPVVYQPASNHGQRTTDYGLRTTDTRGRSIHLAS